MNAETEPVKLSVPPGGEIDLLDYVEVVASRRWFVGATTLAAAALSIAVSLLLPKIYLSTALILPPQQEQGIATTLLGQMPGGLGALAGGLLGGGSTSDLYVGILQSQVVKDVIIDKFKLVDLYEQEFRLDTYAEMDKRIRITAGKKDGIVSIVAEDEDPRRAADLANAFVDELERLTLKLNTSGAGESRGFLEQRLAEAKAGLARAEDALKKFQTTHKVLDVPEQAKASIAGVAELRAQLALQEVQLETSRRTFTEASQEVQNQRAAIENLRKQIAQLEGRGDSSAIPSVGSVPQLGQEYVRLMREFTIQQSLVEILTKQHEMQRLSEARNYSSIQVLQRATPADKKSKPKRRLIVMGGTALGFLTGLAAAFALTYLQGAESPERTRWQALVDTLRARPRPSAPP